MQSNAWAFDIAGGLESDGFGDSGVEPNGQRGWAEVYGCVGKNRRNTRLHFARRRERQTRLGFFGGGEGLSSPEWSGGNLADHESGVMNSILAKIRYFILAFGAGRVRA